MIKKTPLLGAFFFSVSGGTALPFFYSPKDKYLFVWKKNCNFAVSKTDSVFMEMTNNQYDKRFTHLLKMCNLLIVSLLPPPPICLC